MTHRTTIQIVSAYAVVFLIVAIANGAENIVANAYQLRVEGKVDKAKRVLEHALREQPDDGPAWLELARLEFQISGTSRELDTAQEAIDRAISVDPKNALYHGWACRIAVFSAILKSKQKDQMIAQIEIARRTGEQAVSLDPNQHEARSLLVALYGNNPPDLGGDADRAKQHMGILEKREPVYGARARCDFSLKDDPEKKIAHWTGLVKILGEDSRVHENLAVQHAWIGSVEKARAHADEAVELNPDRTYFLLMIARAFALNKQFEPAEQFASRYLELDPRGPVSLRAWAHVALGRVQQMRGDKEACNKLLNTAKDLDPYCWITMTPPPEQLFEAP